MTTENAVLEAIRDGIETVDELAAVIYGDSDEWTRQAIRAHVYQLRQKGHPIISERKGHYILDGAVNTVYCQRCSWSFTGERGGGGPIRALVDHHEAAHSEPRIELLAS